MKIRFAANSNGSMGLRNLKVALQDRGHDALLIKHNKSKYIPKDTDLIINWGIPPFNPLPNYLNQKARNASNKLTAFQLMSPRNKLRWTTDKEEAKTFKLCYCRTLLCSSQGRGIVVARSPEEVVDAPLYTKGIIRVAGEYRVHVFKGQIIDVVQKKKLSTEQRELRGIGCDVNPYIRNHSNGYIFARGDISCPDSVKTVALNAIEDLQLDFGAVDVVVSGYSGGAFVLEVNSAPGIEGTTVEKYVEAIESWYE